MPPRAVRSSRTPLPVALTAVSLLGGACASGQALEIQKVDAVAQPPANIALYLKITRKDGQPVTLLPADFKVYEDGKQIPAKKVKRALLPVKYAVDRYVMVVVDLSGPLVDSEYLSTFQDAVATLAERVDKDARMALSGFDGEGLVSFVGLEGGDARAGLAAMRKFRPRSRNIDLWGSFMTAIEQLDDAIARSGVPHQKAIVVLVTDRKDKAGRHTAEDVLARVKKTKADVYVVGIGDGIDREALEPLGKTAALFAAEPRELDKPFLDIAERVEAQMGEDYLFAYCSLQKASKKSGEHTAEVRIETKRWHGSVEHEFTTKAFTTEPCDPQARPQFKSTGKGGSGEDGDAAEGKKPKGKKRKPVEETEEADNES